MTRPHLVVACVLVATGSAGAQTGIASSFEQLQVLVRAGQNVVVTDASGTLVRGRIVGLSTGSLDLDAAGRRLSFTQAEVREIRQRRGDPLGNGTLWGMGIGVSLPLALFISHRCECGAGVMAAAVGAYAGMGAGIGAGIDALVTSDQTVFRASAPAARVTLSPVMAPGRRGALLTVRF